MDYPVKPDNDSFYLCFEGAPVKPDNDSFYLCFEGAPVKPDNDGNRAGRANNNREGVQAVIASIYCHCPT